MLTRRVDLAALKTEAAGSQVVVYHRYGVTSYAMASDRLSRYGSRDPRI